MEVKKSSRAIGFVLAVDEKEVDARIMFFPSEDGLSRFAWTARSVDGKSHYALHLVNCGRKSRKVVWQVLRRVRFARRWKAKDRAYKWYCDAHGFEWTSLHSHTYTGRNRFERLFCCVVNDGIEDGYDVGVEYYGQVAGSGTGKGMLWVEDRYGKRHRVRSDFFVEVQDG